MTQKRFSLVPSGVRWPAVSLVLGNASYLIYLIHSPLLSITQRVACWVCYRVVERAAQRHFQKRFSAS